MEEKELISRLSCLKQIEPRQEWVALTRKKLFKDPETLPRSQEELGFTGLQKRWFLGILERMGAMVAHVAERPAFGIPALALLVAGGAVWQGAQSSLPGDTLYALKTAAEQVQLGFSGEAERPLRQLELAQKRLADLRLVAEQNKVKNLPSAIAAFEANISEFSGSMAAIVENQPERALQAGKGIVQLQKEEQEIEQILGTTIGGEQESELLNTTRKLVEYELADLEGRSLTEEQEALFAEAKDAAEKEDYAAALEALVEISQEG